MSRSQNAHDSTGDSQSLTAEQIVVLRAFVRDMGGIEQAKLAAEELAKAAKAA